MSIEIKQIRDGPYKDEDGKFHSYRCRIFAVRERKATGKLDCPTLDFFNEHHGGNKHFPQLLALIEKTAREGPRFIHEQFKPVEGTDLFEFKAFQLRVYCFFDGGDLIICTNGTVKKKRRADQSVIKTALNWMNAYFNAKNTRTLSYEI